MRVLAVPQRLCEFERKMDRCGQRCVIDVSVGVGVGVGRRRLVEPRDDRGVVRRSVGEGGAGKTAPGGVGEHTTGVEFVEHGLVVDRVDDDADVCMVLGSGTHHCRPADVDQADAGIGRERVQVDHHEVDRLDAVMGHVGDVLGVGGVGEDPAVDLGVQRDDPVAEDRRQSGELRDIRDGDACVGDGPGRAAARHERPPQLVE